MGLLALGGLLVGCSSTIAGLAVPRGAGGGGGDAGNSSSAGAWPSDEQWRTMDVCSLVPKGTFSSLADTVTRKIERISPSSYSKCPIDLQLSTEVKNPVTGPKQHVNFDMTSGVFDPSVVASPGLGKETKTSAVYYSLHSIELTKKRAYGYEVLTGTTEDGKGQIWAITIAPHKRVLFKVKPRNDYTTMPASKVMTVLRPAVLTVLRHRSVQYMKFPSKSLPSVDLCYALKPAASKLLNGVSKTTPRQHGCYFLKNVSGKKQDGLIINLEYGLWPPDSETAKVQPQSVSGHQYALLTVGNGKYFAVGRLDYGPSLIAPPAHDQLSFTIAVGGSKRQATRLLVPTLQDILAALPKK